MKAGETADSMASTVVAVMGGWKVVQLALSSAVPSAD